MRPPAKALLVVVAAGVCASCTPRGVGATGVGVTEHGHPVGFLHVCDESIDGVTLYAQDYEAEVEDEAMAEAGSWVAPHPVHGTAQWQLDTTSDWDDAAEAVTLSEDEVYAMYGWTDTNSASTDHVTFTQEDLQDLRPEQVLWGDPGRVTSLKEFNDESCDGR
ncbi:hypothetical protein [Serinicoccus sediminis]|uniref:hypothetical protein n=1 Tax=Serinicoccus sediminis TaxID=2306021 RepID=UPI001020C78F|nr:hypothetical protein [Serinicoccus sediminis]